MFSTELNVVRGTIVHIKQTTRFTFNSCSKSNVFKKVGRRSSIQISTVTVVSQTEASEILCGK